MALVLDCRRISDWVLSPCLSTFDGGWCPYECGAGAGTGCCCFGTAWASAEYGYWEGQIDADVSESVLQALSNGTFRQRWSNGFVTPAAGARYACSAPGPYLDLAGEAMQPLVHTGLGSRDSWLEELSCAFDGIYAGPSC